MTQFEHLTQLLPQQPLITSQQANWSNFFLAYYQHPGCEIRGDTTYHILEVIETGSKSQHERCLDGKRLSSEISGGEMFLCPAHTDHWISWEKTLKFSILVFDTAFFKQVADEIESTDRIELTPQWNVFDPVVQNIVRAMKNDIENGCPAGRLYGESFGTALAVHLLKNFSTSKSGLSESSHGLSQHKLKQVLEYIEAHLAEDISLEHLAFLSGISSCYFSRLFKQSMHIAPHQYVIRQRVGLAKQLIRQSDLCIAEISLLCGFSHQSHLSRHFKRLTGLSPNAFRNQ